MSNDPWRYTYRVVTISLLLMILAKLDGGQSGFVNALVIGWFGLLIAILVISAIAAIKGKDRGYVVDDWLDPGSTRRRK